MGTTARAIQGVPPSVATRSSWFLVFFQQSLHFSSLHWLNCKRVVFSGSAWLLGACMMMSSCLIHQEVLEPRNLQSNCICLLPQVSINQAMLI